ncbi:hypothetical protein DUI87_15737 [Hirundo rustica rustica]|uniref:Uncharacterized protein n=1 Tax=Hirundo rustica rustica TaxID=333673 RepID=A0A3M0JZB7_HIRRU|nr:hypothetical protein DUI87_15737 [Hirundo rustica rustica]
MSVDLSLSVNFDNDEASSPWGMMAYLQGGFPQPIKPILLLKCCTDLTAFANGLIQEVSSGHGSERHVENDGSVKLSYPQATTSSSFNSLFDFSFSGHNVGSLFHMADDLGRAMETLVTVMTDDKVLE